MLREPPVSSPRVLVCGGLLALLLGACSGAEAEGDGAAILKAQAHRQDLFRDVPSPVVDFSGAPVDAAAPQRIVSLVPSVTELVFALGLGDRLVGRSRWCDWPPEVAALPDLGGQGSEDRERLVDLRPDLVILLSGRDALARSLREDFGLRVLQPETEGVDEIFRGIITVAETLGVRVRGERLVAHLRKELAALDAAVAGKPRPRVLMVLDREPLFVPGESSFVGDLLRRAGGQNVAAALEATWPTVDLEQVLAWDPDQIIDVAVGADMDRAGLERAAEYWGRLPVLSAVKARRVALLQTGVLTRPGPRMAAAARRLADVIHGE